MWNNCIVASYANGLIRFFDPENGKASTSIVQRTMLSVRLAQMCGSITAHARCLNAIDCNDQGLLASVGDDCFVRMWKLSGDAENLQVDRTETWFPLTSIVF